MEYEALDLVCVFCDSGTLWWVGIVRGHRRVHPPNENVDTTCHDTLQRQYVSRMDQIMSCNLSHLASLTVVLTPVAQ